MGFLFAIPFFFSNKLLCFAWLIKNQKSKPKQSPHNTPKIDRIAVWVSETTFNIDNYNVFAGTATTTTTRLARMKNRGRKIITKIN